MADRAAGPLRKFRVLELGRVFAAPWAGQMLADLGAQVIKVEALDGDPMRQMGTGEIVDGEGRPTGERSVFAAVNRNKRSIAVDLSKPEGVELVRKLAARCDVFMENYKVGDLERRGLGYEALHQLNPRLIYMSLTGYGQTGPYRHRPGMDNIVQGLSGYMSMVGEPDSPPGVSPVSIMDFSAGMHAACGIMAALIERELNGGPGQHLDIALLDSGVALLGYKMVAFLLSGVQPPRGARTRGFIPGGVFRTQDGWLQMTIGPDADFRRFCDATGRADLLADPRYATRWTRTDHQEPLLAEVNAMFLTRTTPEWVACLSEAGLMIAPVLSLAETAQDEQVKARGVLTEITHAAGGRLPLVRNPIRFSETPIGEYRSPPLLNQHAEEVLAEVLGLSPEAVQALRAGGALGPPPA